MKNKIKNIILSNLTLASFFKYLKEKSSGNEKHIFIACLPKSGSTFLTDVLLNITDYKFVQFQPIRGTSDHNIDPGVLLSNLNRDTVTQLHSKSNDSNKKYLLEHNIKVVFLYRDIPSSLKSIYNHILNEENQWFMFTVADNFETWPIEKQFDFLIDMVVPWYINFLTSWEKELTYGELEVLEVDYDNFIDDNETTVKKILNFYGLSYSKNQILSGLEKSYTKKDKLRYTSKNNRVTYTFTIRQMDRIKELIAYYPECSIKI